MERVTHALKAILQETGFDLEYREFVGYSPPDGSRRGNFRDASAQGLREVYGREAHGRNVRVSIAQHSPERLMSELLAALRDELEPFVDPGTGRIGHVCPIEEGSAVRTAREEAGLYHFEHQSDLGDFARGLVQAAALMGVRAATGALADWCRGQPVEIRMVTAWSGPFLKEAVALQGGVELVPLGLSTTELPRLPMFRGDDATDYLGLTLVRLGLRTGPALFRPCDDRREGMARSRSDGGINLELLRDAVSLVTNRHVALSRVWLEYPGAWGFCVTGPTSTLGTDRPKARQWKGMVSGSGRTEITLHDDATPVSVDPGEVESTVRALQGANRKLRIAVDRWRRSMVEDAKLEDRYIDLRVALEAIYLQDFMNEHSQEMRFRLALFGAWHLGANFEERCSIRKALRTAYDTASKAVHEGELPKAVQPDLAPAQDLCRRGILKLLHEGPPGDWGDLVLGADLS